MSNETQDTTQDNEKNQQTEQPDGAKKNESATKKECHACPDCTHAKENKKPCKRLKWKFSMKWWVFALITIVCVGGLIGPFVSQYTYDEDSLHYQMLNAWNMYVGITLGVVATLLSIVSLVFSFHNEEEENIQQRNYSDKFDDINRTLQEIEGSVNATKEKVNDINNRVVQIDKTVSIIKDNQNNATVKSTPPKTAVDPDNVGS